MNKFKNAKDLTSFDIMRQFVASIESENRQLKADRDDLLEACKALKERSAKDAELYAQNGNEPIWAFISDAQDAIAQAEGGVK